MNKLIIGSRSFNIDKENSFLNYSVENNKIISCDLEINFLEGNYKGEKLTPFININTIPLPIFCRALPVPEFIRAIAPAIVNIPPATITKAAA